MKEIRVIVFGSKKKIISLSKHLDSQIDLTFTNHIKAIIKTAFYHPINIARIKGLVANKDQ